MPWADALTGSALKRWFHEAGQGPRVRERKLDPFATSMRNLDDVAPQLESLFHNRPIGHSDAGQRLTDLRSARMVSPDGVTLTRLGNIVRERWSGYGIADNREEHELARELVLVLEALRLSDAKYLEFFRYWEDLAKSFDPETLINNWDKLYAINYLDFERDGFVPGSILRAAQVDAREIDVNLTAIAQLIAGGDTDALRGAQKITDAIQGQVPRGRHRATFCLAMELFRSDLTRADKLLRQFGIPDRPGAWQPLPAATRGLCHLILKNAGTAPSVADLLPIAEPIIDLLQRRHNLILYGPPGTGKTRAAMATADIWRSRHGPDTVYEITFHPSYSYEDFVWGFRPSESGAFVPTPGILLRACETAHQRPTLLLIDEVNRADTARTFGELITYVEADKRDRPFRIAQDPNKEYSIPHRLEVLGTMNTADRSVSLLDVALRRRFAFREFRPDPEAFNSAGWVAEVDGVRFADIMVAINRRLGSIGVEPDRAIGHALLYVSRGVDDAVRALRDRFQYDIHPLIVDYCFSERKKVAAVLSPLVDEDGEFLEYSEDNFIQALRRMTTTPAAPDAEGDTIDEVGEAY